jgi:hypothetical protein
MSIEVLSWSPGAGRLVPVVGLWLFKVYCNIENMPF